MAGGGIGSSSSGESLIQEEATEPLARRLFEKMEHQDLTGHCWSDLDEDERWSYRVLVEHLLIADDLVLAALKAMAPRPLGTPAPRA